MRFIRQTDIIEALEKGPAYSLSELAERLADADCMSPKDWERLKANLSAKLGRLRRSGYVEIEGIGERRRWTLKERLE